MSTDIQIAARFRRSVRIDVDLNDPTALETFYCPRSFADALTAMAQHLKATGQAAFTWTGPYGGGKSSLALAFAALVAGKPKARQLAESAVGPAVTAAIREALPLAPTKWRVLPIIGDRTSLPEVLAASLGVQARPARLRAAVLQELADQSARGGVLLIMDELGRSLEAATANPSELDFLQDLAELASRSDRQLIVIGILHQAFDEYANRLSRGARDQWSKIQGRFVDLPIATAGEETLELLARAIDAPAARRKAIRAKAERAARLLTPTRSEAGVKRLADTLAGCAPLHPVTACLLAPMSRRRFGQNQRSVFGFLNSAERFGFQEFVRTSVGKQLFEPDVLWDYLHANLEPSILASPDGKKWGIALEALERLETQGASLIHHRVFKTIAILDLFKDRSGISASAETLHVAIDAINTAVDRALRDLQDWSAIVFRRHAGAYAPFAGSDFDIEAAVTETIAANPTLDMAQLRGLADMQPRLAKRHHAKTGAMRWFDVSVALVSDLAGDNDLAPRPNAMGTLVLAVPGSGERSAAAAAITQASVDQDRPHDLIVGLADQSWRLAELARELAALNTIERQRSELAGDPVARREVAARITELKALIEATVETAFEGALWFCKGRTAQTLSRRGVQDLISTLADQRFPSAPCIRNELLNRTAPSSNAVAARTALMKRMALNEGEPNLGIEGYPAEGGLYHSLLSATRLHKLTKGGYRFTDPAQFKGDPNNLRPLWSAADEMLADATRPLVTAQDIYAMWQAEPIGLKAGLCPVYFMAYALSRKESVALYRERLFQARFDDLSVEYLARDANDLQIRRVDLTVATRDLLAALADIVSSPREASPFAIARELVSQFDALEPWTRRTQRLSPRALDLRETLKRATDPNRLVFDDLANFLKAKPDAAPKEIAAHVRDALAELRAAYPNTLEELKALLLKELDVRIVTTAELKRLRERANTIRNIGGDLRLNAFVSRLAQFYGTVADMEGLAGLAADKLPRDWHDGDRDSAALALAGLAQQFLRAETFARVNGRSARRSALAVVVGVDNQPTPLFREFEVSDADSKEIADLVAAVESTLAAANQSSRDVILAALAEISAPYLQPEAPKSARPRKQRS